MTSSIDGHKIPWYTFLAVSFVRVQHCTICLIQLAHTNIHSRCKTFNTELAFSKSTFLAFGIDTGPIDNSQDRIVASFALTWGLELAAKFSRRKYALSSLISDIPCFTDKALSLRGVEVAVEHSDRYGNTLISYQVKTWRTLQTATWSIVYFYTLLPTVHTFSTLNCEIILTFCTGVICVLFAVEHPFAKTVRKIFAEETIRAFSSKRVKLSAPWEVFLAIWGERKGESWFAPFADAAAEEEGAVWEELGRGALAVNAELGSWEAGCAK